MKPSQITHSSALVLKAPAKINWALYVLDKRNDGYHNILSLMQCIELYDTLIFEESDCVEVITDIKVPVKENLVYKAALLLNDRLGIKRGVRIRLYKEIPSGAGLGGGSSDAAYTLMGLNKFWDLRLSREELKLFGSEIGSDVPFFFHCPIGIVEGKGDIIKPLDINNRYTILLVKPSVSISTVWAYGQLTKREIELTNIVNKFNNIQLIYNTLKSGDISSIKSKAINDFEGLVISEYPVIGEIKERLLDAGALVAIMSGSGSTVFGLFEDMQKAVDASRHFLSYWNRVVLTSID